MPYAPSRGYDDRVLQLILRRGEDQARGALESGAIWGNTVAGLGQQVGGAIQQYGQQKEIAKRDSAWLQYVQSGEWQKDPKAAYVAAKTMWGPDGDKQFQSLMGVAQLMGEKRDPAADSKSLGALIDGMDRMTEGGRAAAYPQAVALARRVYPELQLSPEYDPQQWAEISPLGKALRGEKAPEGFTLGQGQTRFGPDGQPIAAVAEPPKPEPAFTLGAGEVRYGPDGKPIASRPPKPDAPRAPQIERVETVDAEGKPVTQFVTPTVGATYAKPTGAGKQATGQQRKALNFFNRGKEAQEIASALEEGKTIDPLRLKITPEWLNILQSDPNQAYTQAQSAFTEARLRKDSGAAVPKHEYAKDAVTYFAQPGDSEKTKAQKRASRNTILAGIAFESGDALKEFYGDEADGMIESYKQLSKGPSKADGQPPLVSSPEEARKLPPGTLFRTPDGKTRRR